MTPSDEVKGLQAIITENVKTGQKKVGYHVDEKILCKPKNYKVGDAIKNGFFRSDHQTISKVDIDLNAQYRPYFYDLKDPNDDSDVEMEEGLEAGPKKQQVSTKYNKSAKIPNHNKRVTLSKSDLEVALFRLFQERPEFKLTELEEKLNHPRKTLKDALKNFCKYDFQRRVYSFKYNL